MSARNYEKAKHYAGILALLEHEKLTSISLAYDFMKNISVSCIYMDWTDRTRWVEEWGYIHTMNTTC
tara:strand:+ start:319 stop:519 length:201 start_codon:yes stop_codon:yes gene_type:complete